MKVSAHNQPISGPRIRPSKGTAPSIPTDRLEPAQEKSESKTYSKTTAANRMHKTSAAGWISLGGMAVGGTLLAKTALAGVLAASGPVGVAVTAAAVAGSAVAGYLGADLASGFIHFGLDNYPKSETPVLGKLADNFQYHHHNSQSVFARSFIDNCGLVGKLTAPVAVGLGLAVGSPALAAAGLAFTAGLYLLQGSHMLAHDTRPSKVAKTLQRFHITQSKKNHSAHHTRPWESNYTVVNGACNPILEKTHFWRKLEKGIFKVTGREPKSWRHEPTKQFALGNIDAQQYKESFKSGMADFQVKAEDFLKGYLERNPGSSVKDYKDI
ncbi:hypothetical protein JST97_20380 [bacterium]|nr:hypothetical protein [bacterium]